MSPVVNRARSSSVTAMLKSTGAMVERQTHQNGQICTSASATGLTAYTSSNFSSPAGSTSNLTEEMLDGVNASPWALHTANSPPTYELNWSDVNQLELDFVVYQTLPNIRKQLSPNEVNILFC